MGLGETARGIIEEECVCEFARYGKDRQSHMVHVVAHIVLGESLGRAEEVRGSAGVCCRAFCERPTTHLVAVGLYPVVVFSALAVGHGTQYPWVAANQPTGEARDPHAAGDTSRGFRCRQIFTKLVVGILSISNAPTAAPHRASFHSPVAAAALSSAPPSARAGTRLGKYRPRAGCGRYL